MIRGNVWIINFNGLGNGVMIAPILSCLEQSFPDSFYFHTFNEVLSDDWFRGLANIKKLVDFSPVAWRRFEQGYWDQINDFISKNDIRLVINVRNEGPKYDIGYYDYVDKFKSKNLVFIDLDFETIIKRKEPSNLTSDIVSLFSKYGVNCDLVNHYWLAKENPFNQGIGIGMAGSHKNKRWKTKKWSLLVQKLAESGQKITIFPGKSDEEISAAKDVQSLVGNNCEVVTDKTVPELTRLIQDLKVFVANDTGLLHIAAACNIFTIGIYTCTDPNVWSPLSVKKFYSFSNKNFMHCPCRKIHCGNCFHYYDECPAILNYEDTIDPEEVYKTIIKCLAT